MNIASIRRNMKRDDYCNLVFRIRDHYCAVILSLLFICLFSRTVFAQNNNEWHVFHGFRRDNKSDERGLLKKWPENGPKLIWTVSGLGEGYSSVTIADRMLFTAGKKNNQSYVFAYDLNGKLLWEMPNGWSYVTELSWAKAYTGSRGTPTYDDGVIYQLGESGRLAAFNHKTGKELICRRIELIHSIIN